MTHSIGVIATTHKHTRNHAGQVKQTLTKKTKRISAIKRPKQSRIMVYNKMVDGVPTVMNGGFSRTAYLEGYTGYGDIKLASAKALVVNQATGEALIQKNIHVPSSIASVTKLMTAMVTLDAKLALDEIVTISIEDMDFLKGTGSRLPLGARLSRGELLELAIMASENRAAAALGRTYPGGLDIFVRAMNEKAKALGMESSQFADPTGLDSNNLSTAEDLVKMTKSAYQYPEIRAASTKVSLTLYLPERMNPLTFKNTNGLVRGGDWNIGLSKTGFINEAGRCLVMQAEIGSEQYIFVLLDSNAKNSRIGDANRIRKWIEQNKPFSANKYNS